MTIVNVMWSSGPAFASVHKVHHQMLSLIAEQSIQSWLLQGVEEACHDSVGDVRVWQLPRRLVKGRRVWRWLQLPLRWRMRQALRERKARLVLLDGIGTARLLLPVISCLSEVRGVVVFHGQTNLRPRDVALLHALPASQLRLIAVSEVLAKLLQTQLGMPVAALRSSLDPYDFSRGLLSGAEARQRLGVAAHDRVLGAVGRLVPDKGFETMLKAFATVAREQDDLRLVLVGEGELRPALERRILDLGLQGRVLLPGHLDDMARLYRAFDWMLIPSFVEGLGLVLQEAVMAGVPVLASDIPVFHEQLGNAGLYAAAGDAESWKKMLRGCLALDPLEVAGRQVRFLDPERAWQRFSDTCKELLVID